MIAVTRTNRRSRSWGSWRSSRQKGATLIVGLIFLVLITVMVTMAFTMSTSNQKVAGNLQYQAEASSAANRAIEDFIAGRFSSDLLNSAGFGLSHYTDGSTQTINLSGGGNVTYQVTVTATCIASAQVPGTGSQGKCSSIELGMTCGAPTYNTLWDVQAVAVNASTGTKIEMHQGVRAPLSEARNTDLCP